MWTDLLSVIFCSCSSSTPGSTSSVKMLLKISSVLLRMFWVLIIVLVSLLPYWSYCPRYFAILAACFLATGSWSRMHLIHGLAASTAKRVKAPWPSLVPTCLLASQQFESLVCRLSLM